jgi:hypothetical protein
MTSSNKAPSFSDVEYWDQRFHDNTNSFDWLLPESCFDEQILSFQERYDASRPLQVLHIGSGTSMLSFHLPKILTPGSVSHNVDFSREGVEWGKNMETKIDAKGQPRAKLEWHQASLLSLSSLLSCSQPRSINLVVDKSTSDAIACGPDVQLSLPYFAKDTEVRLPTNVHPLHILALDLAVVAVPGARWLSLSYSKERFPFVPTLFAPHPAPLPDGVPDPARFWKFIERKEIQTEEALINKYKNIVGQTVHTITTSHYMYVLERSQEELDPGQVLALQAASHSR